MDASKYTLSAEKIGCLDRMLSAAIAIHKGAISVRN